MNERGARLFVNLNYIFVPQRLGLVNLLALEAAVTPKPRELHVLG